MSHENFVALDKINGAFWACVACRANVIGYQNNEIENLQNNFQQSVAGIRDDLQKEITEFKSEILNNIEEIKLTLKSSRYENELQKLTENLRANADLTSQSERENKIIVFGVSEKTSDTMITVLDRISHDKKKSVEELARKIGIQTLNIEDTAGGEALKYLEFQNHDDVKCKIEGRQYFYNTVFYRKMSGKKKNKL